MRPSGQVHYFRSHIDGELCPYAFCATDTGSEPKPLVVDVTPGALNNLARAVSQAEEVVALAPDPCVTIRPTGRGGGSMYQNYGEIDVLEAIGHVSSYCAIDPDRISVTGPSMGGAAVWYLISHYPDLFAAAAPFDGYCDYRLWEKPGGTTFHLNDWEIPSWQSRSAPFLVENLQHTPVWITHGEWDRAIGGGVSVEHSRGMARLLEERGYAFRYSEVPETGHGSRTPERFAEVLPWLLQQRKDRSPKHFSLASYDLRHNHRSGASILQLAEYGARGLVEVRLDPRDGASVRTENIRALSLDAPVTGGVTIDGQDLGQPGCGTFTLEGGNWQRGAASLASEKHPSSAGPLGDLFFDRTVLVPGTIGSAKETLFNTWSASNAQEHYKIRNGGVHRGGILGVNAMELAVVNDQDVSDELLAQNNLILYGTDRSNSVFKELASCLPLAFTENSVTLAGKQFTGPKAAIFAVLPHPRNPQRCLAVHGAAAPDAISWGSHLDMHLLPDYIAYAQGEVLGWGFCDNQWKPQRAFA